MFRKPNPHPADVASRACSYAVTRDAEQFNDQPTRRLASTSASRTYAKHLKLFRRRLPRVRSRDYTSHTIRRRDLRRHINSRTYLLPYLIIAAKPKTRSANRSQRQSRLTVFQTTKYCVGGALQMLPTKCVVNVTSCRCPIGSPPLDCNAVPSPRRRAVFGGSRRRTCRAASRRRRCCRTDNAGIAVRCGGGEGIGRQDYSFRL